MTKQCVIMNKPLLQLLIHISAGSSLQTVPSRPAERLPKLLQQLAISPEQALRLRVVHFLGMYLPSD